VPPESLVAYVAEATAGVHPLARYPNGDVALPNKLFEFLHAGLPMIVSDSPAMADFVRRHNLGEVAPLEDVEAWAGAIGRVVTSPDSFGLAPGDRDSLLREWSWETQERRLFAVYRELLGSRAPAALVAAAE
jgi:glycosyltransferase involved in cell wall biosynthesis